MISQTELISLAALARLALNESEPGTLIRDFDSVLDYVDQLKTAPLVDGAGEEIGPAKNVGRTDDEPHRSQPSRQFKVKAVFEN